MIIKKDVGRFKISVNDSLCMAISNSCEHLIKELFDFDRFHEFGSECFKVCFEIFVEVFENEVKLFLINDNVFQSA